MASNIGVPTTDSAALAKARSVVQNLFKDALHEKTSLNVGSSNTSTAEARNILHEFFQDSLPPHASLENVLAKIRLKLQEKLDSLAHERDDMKRRLSQEQERGNGLQRRLQHEDDLRKMRQVTEKLQEKNKRALEEQVLRLQKRLANCRCHLRPISS